MTCNHNRCDSQNTMCLDCGATRRNLSSPEETAVRWSPWSPPPMGLDLQSIRRFFLERAEDLTGVSGTGIIAIGVRLPTGRCVMEWTGKIEQSIVIWSSVEKMLEVVTHQGRNDTKLRWLDWEVD